MPIALAASAIIVLASSAAALTESSTISSPAAAGAFHIRSLQKPERVEIRKRAAPLHMSREPRVFSVPACDHSIPHRLLKLKAQSRVLSSERRRRPNGSVVLFTGGHDTL